jgi:hypothetical protein
MRIHRSLLIASFAWAHDLLLKLDSYLLEPHARVRIPALNGTFAKSEGVVSPDRLADISVVSPAGRTTLSPAAVWVAGETGLSVLTLEIDAPAGPHGGVRRGSWVSAYALGRA